MDRQRSGRPVVILGGMRTPWVKAGADLAKLHATELARIPAEEILLRLRVPPEAVDEVILGNVGQPADSANVARVVALRLGLPVAVPALTVHRNCASGMESISQAFDKIRFGLADLVLAGGTESMSSIPVLFGPAYTEKLSRLARSKTGLQRARAAAAFRPRDLKPVIALEEGLTDPVCGLNMGETAETLARELGISREEQDRFALESHRRAVQAIEDGRLSEEIVPVHAPPDFHPVTADIGPRKNQTLEALAKLRPYFERDFGTVTVGNSCPITDGGCAVVVASEDKARELGIEPLGWISSYAYKGCAPERMGLGPAYASPTALDLAGVRLADVDLIEINEAFAAQVLANVMLFESASFARTELGRAEPIGKLDLDRTNVNGGAIALGHPVGASGARLVLTLLLELRRRGLRRGLATLCVGGGQGAAMVVERKT